MWKKNMEHQLLAWQLDFADENPVLKRLKHVQSIVFDGFWWLHPNFHPFLTCETLWELLGAKEPRVA